MVSRAKPRPHLETLEFFALLRGAPKERAEAKGHAEADGAIRLVDNLHLTVEAIPLAVFVKVHQDVPNLGAAVRSGGLRR